MHGCAQFVVVVVVVFVVVVVVVLIPVGSSFVHYHDGSIISLTKLDIYCFS